MPPKKTQGPVLHGLENPYCSDLSGRGNSICETKKKNYMEYLVVEFASDVEQQTSKTSTTQETVGSYLKRQLKHRKVSREDNVCVVNTGTHDQRLCVNHNTTSAWCDDMFLTNVETYLKILDTVCGNIIWISQASVRGDEDYPQRNDVSLRWNEGVKLLGERLFGSTNSFYYLDVWTLSEHSKHTDNVHFQSTYYDTIGALFTELMK
jgi:hypothetical protein